MQSSSSRMIMPPLPMIDPALANESKSMGMSSHLAGMQPPGGPAGLHRFDLPAAGHTAADFIDHLAQRGAHRHFDQPGVLHLAGQREDLGAAAVGSADAVEPIGPVDDDSRHVGERLDIVDHGGLAPEPGPRWDRGAGSAAGRVRPRSSGSGPFPRHRRRLRRRAGSPGRNQNPSREYPCPRAPHWRH